MENLTIYELFYICPTWVILATLIFICINSLPDIRDIKEGFGYNNSRGSRNGDFGIIIGLMFGIEILKRQPHLPGWTTNIMFNLPAITMSIIGAGMYYHYGIIRKPNEKQTVADAFHNIIIVPLLVFSVLLILPIFWLYGSGLERILAFCFALLWPITMYFDAKQGRLKNLNWLVTDGIERFIAKIDAKYLELLIKHISTALEKRRYDVRITPLVQGKSDYTKT